MNKRGRKKSINSQYAAIKAHLIQNGEITSLEAIMLYQASRVSAIIYTLRKEGYEIETEYKHGVSVFGNASAYAKYILKGVPKE